MAFDNSYTAVTGSTYQASDYNTGTKGNFTAVWVGTTAGDIDYYTSATAKNRLALVAGGLLYGGATAPAWLANAAGGVLYGGASAPAYLAAGAANTFLRSTGSVPEYAPLVSQRQGGSSTIWTSPGTTTYTPTATLMQLGYKAISFSSSTGSSTAVTYPTAFTQRPAIILFVEAAYTLTYMWSLGHTDDTTSGFNYNVKWSGAYTGTINFGWLAIGL
jgi:hypothetical protein